MMAALIGAKEEQHSRTPEDEELEIAEATMKLEKKALSPVLEEEEPLDALKRAMRAELPTTRQRADTPEDCEELEAMNLSFHEGLDEVHAKLTMRLQC